MGTTTSRITLDVSRIKWHMLSQVTPESVCINCLKYTYRQDISNRIFDVLSTLIDQKNIDVSILYHASIIYGYRIRTGTPFNVLSDVVKYNLYSYYIEI